MEMDEKILDTQTKEYYTFGESVSAQVWRPSCSCQLFTGSVDTKGLAVCHGTWRSSWRGRLGVDHQTARL